MEFIQDWGWGIWKLPTSYTDRLGRLLCWPDHLVWDGWDRTENLGPTSCNSWLSLQTPILFFSLPRTTALPLTPHTTHPVLLFRDRKAHMANKDMANLSSPLKNINITTKHNVYQSLSEYHPLPSPAAGGSPPQKGLRLKPVLARRTRTHALPA